MREGGARGGLQHVVNPQQKTGESLFIEGFKSVCVWLCACVFNGWGVGLNLSGVGVSTTFSVCLGSSYL